MHFSPPKLNGDARLIRSLYYHPKLQRLINIAKKAEYKPSPTKTPTMITKAKPTAYRLFRMHRGVEPRSPSFVLLSFTGQPLPAASQGLV